MNISLSGKKPVILVLLKGAALFFLGLCLLAVFLYVAGTRQNFMDSTQLLLIHGAVLTGIALGCISIYGIIAEIWFLIRSPGARLRFIGGIASYFFLVMVGGLVAAAGSFIAAVAGGNLS
jgi:hypothetical protein